MAETNYAEAIAQQDVISELLGKSFAARTVFCEQKDILQHKKPLPRLRVRTSVFTYSKKNGMPKRNGFQ